MQDVNSDMDDIFKEAADKYSLKTNNADWKAVRQKLYTGENKGGIVYNERKLIIVFLLLLMPTGLIITHYFKVQKEAQTVTKVEHKQIKSPGADRTENVINRTEPDKQVTTEADKKINTSSSKEEYNRQKKNNNITIQKNHAEEQNNLVSGSLKNKKKSNDLNQFYLPGHLNNNMIEDKPAILSEGSSKLSESIKDPNAQTNKIASREGSKRLNGKSNRFYIGVVIAPEFTSVKFQPVKRTSFNLGILMGYSLSDKIGFEVGATFGHKYYYTNGKYIVPNSIRQDNSKILNVYAFNSLTEMPLTVQYNIKNEKNNRFFAGAGCVSYVIHKEHYNYTYTKNGEEKQSIKYYNKASNNWFANAQVSVGYEYSGSKIGNITIEPYYRIPLKGVGISDLPITSIGINFAFTKNVR
ncbi:MAG TPA: outer membrane beta-barrel protein [Chitinophagaceae bacterium]|jgi:hypothetical protein